MLTGNIPDLHVAVVDADIIVTMPGTAYAVTYYKPRRSPGLLAKRIADKDDPRAGLSLSRSIKVFVRRSCEGAARTPLGRS